MPNLLNSLSFHSPDLTTFLPLILSTILATLRQPISLVFMSLYACLSNDHSPGTSSSSLELQFSKFDSTGSAVGLPGSAIVSPASQSESSIGLSLVVDLSSYPLQ